MHKSSIELQGNIANTLLSDAVFRPMLFSTPMVHALLNGTKTQTRRLVKIKEYGNLLDKDVIAKLNLYHISTENEAWFSTPGVNVHVKIPYNIGDIIWVRETSKSTYTVDANDREQFIYKTDSKDVLDFMKPQKWKPSLFMTKEASRIWLKVTNVRIEKLHKITDEDARSEGVEYSNEFGYKLYAKNDFFSKHLSASDSYMSLWEKINGKNSWKENPWVFVYEFEVLLVCPYGFR